MVMTERQGDEAGHVQPGLARVTIGEEIMTESAIARGNHATIKPSTPGLRRLICNFRLRPDFPAFPLSGFPTFRLSERSHGCECATLIKFDPIGTTTPVVGRDGERRARVII